VALLAAAQAQYENYGVNADPWMTLVGYFNSLRELGGMRRLVDDDVKTRLLQMDRRGLVRRKRLFVDELTSRKNSTDIPQILDQLEMTFDPAALARELVETTKKHLAAITVGPWQLSLVLFAYSWRSLGNTSLATLMNR
jgi:hypothetical protein